MANFDQANLALQMICPNNEILYDDKGMPSVMVKIPKMTLKDLGIGTSTQVHPAFIVNGQTVDAIYISKYQNIVENNRAYSLPAKNPKIYNTFSASVSACSPKGAGWHLMTRAEWALLALWCKKNNTQPLGNNNYGKDASESTYKAIPMDTRNNKINHVATGTGPVTWSHDGTLSGIWDLNGNSSEWVNGVRVYNGELQVIANNDAAAGSTAWKAILADDGTLVAPGTTGTIKMSCNNIGTDQTPKYQLEYSTIINSSVSRGSFSSNFSEITTDDSTISDSAKELLYALALLPNDNTSGAYNNDSIGFNNSSDDTYYYISCGGGSTTGNNAGVFRHNYTKSLTPSETDFAGAFRCAYYHPAEV